MKTNTRFRINLPARAAIRAACLAMAALLAANFAARAQDEAAAPATAPQQAAATNTAAEETQSVEKAQSEGTAASSTNATEIAKVGTDANGITLNFHNASIDQVLQFLSKAAGFTVVYDTQPVGRVSVIGQNLTKDEVVDLVNYELNKNGYGAVRSGARILRIMDRQSIKTAGNPVRVFNGDPASIPDDSEVATWIIPIRYVEAQQLVSDISPFVSSGATIIANQAGNSVIITDAQSNTRHLTEIIKAIDSSAEDLTEVRVFHLNYADPTEMATLLTGLFPDQTGATAPIQFRRGGGGRGGRGGAFGGGFNPFAAAFGGGQNTGNNQADRIKQRKQVVAVADPRTSSVVVTATSDLMNQIEEMVTQLDHPGKQVRMVVIPVNNVNANDLVQALQDTVGANSTRNRNASQTDPLADRIRTFQNQYGGSSSSTSTGLGGGRGGRGGFGQ